MTVAAGEPFHIGDHVVINSGPYYGQTGQLVNFDFPRRQLHVDLHRMPLRVILTYDQIDHLPVMPWEDDEDEDEDVPVDELEVLETDGPWNLRTTVIAGAHEGRTGELIGPNDILSERVGEAIINLQFDDGSLQSVALRNVEFVFPEADDE